MNQTPEICVEDISAFLDTLKSQRDRVLVLSFGLTSFISFDPKQKGPLKTLRPGVTKMEKLTILLFVVQDVKLCNGVEAKAGQFESAKLVMNRANLQCQGGNKQTIASKFSAVRQRHNYHC